MTTFEKFEVAARAEQVLAGVYGLLAERQEPGSTAERLFIQLQQEGEQHALRIKMLRKRYTANSVREVSLDVEQLQALQLTAESLRDRVVSGELTTNAPGLMRLLADAERQFAAAQAALISGAGDAGVQAFFEQLAAQDRGHQALLKRLAS
jgi:hypothetical protein